MQYISDEEMRLIIIDIKVRYKISEEDWEIIQNYFNRELHSKQLCSWSKDDIIEYAEELGYELTQNQTDNIFKEVSHAFARNELQVDDLKSIIEDYFETNPDEKFEALL